jgi:hypothetical protein
MRGKRPNPELVHIKKPRLSLFHAPRTTGDDDEDEDTTQPMSLIGIAVFKVSFTLVHFKSKQSQLRKIVRHVWSSPQRRRTWEGFGGRLILILDVKTRWPSTRQMLRTYFTFILKHWNLILIGRALDFRLPIYNHVASDSELQEHVLTSAEWEALLTVSKWLQAFCSATTEMSTTKLSMLSTTHTMFRGLQHHLKTLISTLPSSADPALKAGLVNAHRKLSDYFTKFDGSHNTAHGPYLSTSLLFPDALTSPHTVLDPRILYEALRKDYADDADLLGDLEISRATLETHFEAN